MKKLIQNMTNDMVDNNISKEQTQSNLKNGYIALSMTFFTTLLGYLACINLFPGLMNLAVGVSGLLFIAVFIGMVMAIYQFKDSSVGLFLLLALGALEGIFIAPLVSMSSPGTVLSALGGTIALALGTSVIAIKGHESGTLDSSSWGKFLFVALIGLVVAVIINLFLQSTMFQIFLSSGIILIMSGLMIYDTQQALKYPRQSYIVVALGFYLNIINIFINLLYLLNLSED